MFTPYNEDRIPQIDKSIKINNFKITFAMA